MEHLAEPPIAGSWQLPGTYGCSSEICSIPISARLNLYGPVMDLSDVHHAAMRPWGSLWTAIAAAQHQPVHNRSLKVTSDVRN